MERNICENDGLIQQMASYKFDSSIKVSYVFEDCEEIDANISEKSRPRCSGRNTPAENEIIKIPSNDIYNSNATFNNNFDRPNGPVKANENQPPTSNAANGHTIRLPNENSYLISNSCKSFQTKHINEVTYPANSSKINPNATILNLLDTVSDNLICITKYYHRYCTDFVRTQGKSDAREWYLSYKHHYFNLSYSVSVSLFLLHENNQSFITTFITRTIELANSKSWFNISFENLKQLVSDMIQWTKQKKKYLEASTNHLRQPKHTVKPKSNYDSNLNPRKRNNTEDLSSICLFATGPPGKEMRITFDPTTLLNGSGEHPKESNTVKATKRRSGVVYDNMITKRQKSQKKNSNTCNQTISPTSTWNPPANTIHNSQFFQTPNACNNITLDYNLNKVSSGIGQNKDCESKEQPLILRSVSRDSGFGSPVLSLDDNTVYSNGVENPQLFLEEVPITHGASSFPNGPCKVCSSSTKKMCIGCYQEYYCSYACQKADWPLHMLKCRPTHHSNNIHYQ